MWMVLVLPQLVIAGSNRPQALLDTDLHNMIMGWRCCVNFGLGCQQHLLILVTSMFATNLVWNMYCRMYRRSQIVDSKFGHDQAI